MGDQRFRRWVWLVLKHSLTRSGHGEGVGVVTIATLQTVFLWLLIAGFATSGLAALLGWIQGYVPLLTGVGTFLMLFVVAPYQLWESEAVRADLAEATLAPRIAVRLEVVEEVIGGTNYHICVIRISNEAGGTVADCEVTVVRAQLSIADTTHDAGLLPFKIRWPTEIGGGGTSLAFHDQAFTRVFARRTRGSHSLEFFDGLAQDAPGSISLAESPTTFVDISVAAQDSIRWLGTIEATVDPTGARCDEYRTTSGHVAWGEPVDLTVALMGVDDRPLLLTPSGPHK